MNRYSKKLLAGTAIAVAAISCASSPAWAQTETTTAPGKNPAGTPAANPAQPTTVIDGDIIVTAQRRDSTVQRTPISITAISGAQLQARGITDLKGIVANVPGVSIRSAGPGQSSILIRGLSPSGGSSPTVGLYFNDTVLPSPVFTATGKPAVDPDFYDLNRVEVLRGPQGTLFGAGSMGGTVRLIANQPDLNEFGASADFGISATKGGAASPGGDAMINLPIVEGKLAIRAVVTAKNTGGWIDRIVVPNFPTPINPCGAFGAVGCDRGNVLASPASTIHKNVNSSQLRSERISLLAEPSDRLSIEITGMHSLLRTDGYSTYDEPPGSSEQAHYQPFDIKEPLRDNFSLVEGTATYHASGFDVTSVTSYSRRSLSQTQDASEALESFFDAFIVPIGFIPITISETNQSRQFTQEFRLSSASGSRLKWVAGLYYSNLKATSIVDNASPLVAFLSRGGAAANPKGEVFFDTNNFTVRQIAAFADLTYAITDTVSVAAGGRYFNIRTNISDTGGGILSATGNGSGRTNISGETDKGFTPRVNISYQPSANLNIYASASKGFRPGASGNPIPPTLGCQLTDPTYKGDTVWTYELGEKAKLFNGRVTLNADGYYTRWSNVQQLVVQACGFGLTTNAGVAEAYGPEVELSAKITPNLTLALSGTYTKAHIISVNPLVAAATDAIKKGDPLLNVPEVTFNASLDYRRPISPSLDFVARVFDSYVGSNTDVSFFTEKLDPYNIVDARIGVAAKTWSAYLFVNNITDKVAKISINTTSLSYVIPSLTRVATNQPRTVGFTISKRF